MQQSEKNYSNLPGVSDEVLKVLSQLNSDQSRSNGRFGALGKRVKFNPKAIAIFPELETIKYDDGSGNTEDLVIFSEPRLSGNEPLILQIAKQEKDLH